MESLRPGKDIALESRLLQCFLKSRKEKKEANPHDNLLFLSKMLFNRLLLFLSRAEVMLLDAKL